MSSQVAFLRNLIASAQSGNEGAEPLLRQICVAAAEKAPLADLITMAHCLTHVGAEATRRQLELN